MAEWTEVGEWAERAFRGAQSFHPQRAETSLFPTDRADSRDIHSLLPACLGEGRVRSPRGSAGFRGRSRSSAPPVPGFRGAGIDPNPGGKHRFVIGLDV